MKTLKIFTLLAFVLLIASCSDDPQTTGCETDFDQEAMFTNLADNLIIPGYNDLKARVNELNLANDDFQTTINATNLEELQTAWFAAYYYWQRVSQYDLGPASDVFLQNSLNNFPLDTAIVYEKIQNSDYDFTSPDAYDKGFPALDYLLFGVGNDDTEIINQFANNPKYLQYLDKVIEDITTRVEATATGWDAYRAVFVTNTGTAAGSSLSLIVNGFNQNYEYIKRDKLGIPSGILTLGFTNPTKVEAYYSGRSLELADQALTSSWYFYLGVEGLGLDDYLQAIGTMKGDKTLDAAIQEQFSAARATLARLGTSTPLSELVESDTQSIVEAYNEVTKQLINIKTDMPSVLCVSITYIDNPSDSD
jgi:predicted lipoprotein